MKPEEKKAYETEILEDFHKPNITAMASDLAKGVLEPYFQNPENHILERDIEHII